MEKRRGEVGGEEEREGFGRSGNEERKGGDGDWR